MSDIYLQRNRTNRSTLVRWCIRLTRLTLVCEVIRYRLVQVRQNQKKHGCWCIELFWLGMRLKQVSNIIFWINSTLSMTCSKAQWALVEFLGWRMRSAHTMVDRVLCPCLLVIESHFIVWVDSCNSRSSQWYAYLMATLMDSTRIVIILVCLLQFLVMNYRQLLSLRVDEELQAK